MRSLIVPFFLVGTLACGATMSPNASLIVSTAPDDGQETFGPGETVGFRLTVTNTEDTTVAIHSYGIRLVAPLSAIEQNTNTLINNTLVLDPPSYIPPAQLLHLTYNVTVNENMTARPGRYQLVFSVSDLDLSSTTVFSVRASR